jgi:dipeptidyl-peptidase-4
MRTFASALFAIAAATAVHAEPVQLTTADYDRAARFLRQNTDTSVLNGSVTPHWLPEGDRFWYRRSVAPGRTEFVVIDAAGGGRRAPAFDHAAVASALSTAMGKPMEADRLPFKSFRYGDKGAVEAVAGGKLWTCGGAPVVCTSVDAPKPLMDAVASPDGKWLAYVKDDNLWVRPVSGGEGFALTRDGAPGWGYATPAGSNYMATQMRIAGLPYPPAVAWSPDSTRILTQRVDDRKVGSIGLVQSVPADGSVRPKVYSWRVPFPGEAEVATAEPWVFDVTTRKGVKVDVAPIQYGLVSPTEMKEAWWAADGKSVNLVTHSRYVKTMKLYRVDPATGGARELVSEDSKTFIEAAGIGVRPNVELLQNGDVLWFSERDGDGRLYLYGPDGRVKRVLGTGPGQVSNIVRVDEANGQVWVRANGREPGPDPYASALYRIDMKTGASVRLTPEGGEHSVGTMDRLFMEQADPMIPSGTTKSVSPSGRYFVDSFSTPATAPVTVLRRADGKLVATLEHADLSPLKAAGFTPPEPFTAMAADGKTTLYGVILRPANFDPSKRYPVVDQIYPGPQVRRVTSGFMETLFEPAFAQGTAELGFVVVLIDGRGTPGRGKAFLDQSYGKLANGGFLEDHVAAIKEIGKSRPWMDLDKVGIYGYSGGGYATARAMFMYPDFYKVGVAHAGAHDERAYVNAWGETYNGPIEGDNYSSLSNAAIAKNLKGKLLLMHGETDANVSPALTMQVADALIKANKDFDLLIIPNLGHTFGPYGTRRTWDYLVTNLMGATPPKEYRIQ